MVTLTMHHLVARLFDTRQMSDVSDVYAGQRAVHDGRHNGVDHALRLRPASTVTRVTTLANTMTRVTTPCARKQQRPRGAITCARRP